VAVGLNVAVTAVGLAGGGVCASAPVHAASERSSRISAKDTFAVRKMDERILLCMAFSYLNYNSPHGFTG
jgi:hypothetical protein